MIEGMKSPELFSKIYTYQVFHMIASRNDLKALTSSRWQYKVSKKKK